MADFGYAGEILKINFSGGNITRLPTAGYAERFIGGRGLAAGLYWEMVPPDARALDPENCLICTSGPVAGFPGFAGGRWQVCGKSASVDPEAFSFASLGERWGIRLKSAGFDGLVIQGKSDKPVYIYIHDGTVEIKKAQHLWGKSAYETCLTLKAELGEGTNVLATGQAAENLVSFATILTDEGASGSGGMGCIMGSKKLKAIVVAGDRKPLAADPEELHTLAKYILQIRKVHFPEYPWIIPGITSPHSCYGCGIGCTRQSYRDGKGHRWRLYCIPAAFYRAASARYQSGTAEILQPVRLIDQYGLDALVMQPLLTWLMMCYKEGILNDEQTGLPLSRIGSPEFIETLARKIAFREGFGDLLADGTLKATESIGPKAKELLIRLVSTTAGEGRDYDPRMIPHNSMLYATEPRRPISQLHDAGIVLLRWHYWLSGMQDEIVSTKVVRGIAERFWGSIEAADYTSPEGKGLAAKNIQDRNYAKESLGLCDLVWPIMYTAGTHDYIGDPALESRIYSAITGRKTDEAGLNQIGERIFNLVRAIRLRQGWKAKQDDRLLDYLFKEPLEGTYSDPECRVPGKDGKIAYRKGAVVDREGFEKMQQEYYQIRGWDGESGLPTVTRLKELGLGDVADDLRHRGMVK